MPHSTCFSSPPPPIPEAKPLPPAARPSPLAVRPSQMDFPASLKSSPRSPIKPPRAASPPRKRFFVTTRGHGRSKSASATMTFPPSYIPSLAPPSPTPTIPRRRREYAPPLLRSTSLPLVIPEGKIQLALTMTPPTPTTPPATHRSSFLVGVPRSASPTRVYASSLTPAGARNGYYPGSSFSPRAPSPPSFLVNEMMYPPSASSSSPSTPTSIRSRSPSISSLETIPDSPDAEQEAVEAELREAMERKAAKLENEDEDDGSPSRRRRSVDFDRGLPRWGAADKRKRWSVCGGEKRGDLDLETIWEEALNSAEANHNNIMAHRDESSDEDDEREDEDEEEDEIDDNENALEDEEEEEEE
ncbi:hypothetical protein BZA05DRAFT_274850 [Tricharina praecox]|uniref:uncharacterized protein n=1 Tax=Tricharina praecox TaxID=43433 RepID=UPI00221FE744|nr:uncharacterized protein BZA05DRAFT_274850 [Tricharina praecox]KAI5853938.1 hypothetical protein BZA05DRAFT_274850 [Tricharina praecox]